MSRDWLRFPAAWIDENSGPKTSRVKIKAPVVRQCRKFWRGAFRQQKARAIGQRGLFIVNIFSFPDQDFFFFGGVTGAATGVSGTGVAVGAPAVAGCAAFFTSSTYFSNSFFMVLMSSSAFFFCPP